MALLTFKEAKDSYDLANVLGVCTDSAQARGYINKATRMLMTRGNFWGTVQLVQGCVINECVTWFRYVGTILAVHTCGQTAGVWNNWMGFVPIGPAGAQGEGFCFRDGNCFGNVTVDNFGTSPVFDNVACGKAFYIRAYPQTRLDIGKKITIFGIDSNGQVIRTKRADGTLQEGAIITINVPFGSSTMLVREITRVVKDVTQGVIRLFQYDSTNDKLISMAAYDPTETSPDYRVTKIRGELRNCCCCPGTNNRMIKALVKLAFIPVVNDNDLVLIENLDALAMMIQAIRNRDAANLTVADKLEASAIRELNLELRNRFPLNQTPILINPFGTALPARHGIGRII